MWPWQFWKLLKKRMGGWVVKGGNEFGSIKDVDTSGRSIAAWRSFPVSAGRSEVEHISAYEIRNPRRFCEHLNCLENHETWVVKLQQKVWA
jgi:hypothetical protein